MKILSIRIKNLASLSGEHFIDFESDPLASAGLIAIVGKTGAGKSTLLDAMCLALFNKIPRLKDSDGKLQDVDGSELLTNSPLTVLRRGTAHGFAELCFVAQDQKHYLARWEIKRARDKANGKLQSVQRYLKCLTDGVVVADKAKAVDEHIKRITQLTFEQFTRAVLLAQSEVTAFLKARDSERGELLEYLTNSSIFAKIGQLAFEKTRSVATQRKEIENVLGHIETLSEEDLAQTQTAFEECSESLNRLESEKSVFDKQQQWFERKEKNEHEIALKQASYEQQLQQQKLLEPEKQRLSQLEIFADIRPVVFQKQQSLQQQQQLLPKVKTQQQVFDQIAAKFNAEKVLYTQVETALNQIQSFEQQHHNALSEVHKCVMARDEIAENYKKLKAKSEELKNHKKPLLQQQQQAEQYIEQLKQKQHTLEQEILKGHRFQALDQGIYAQIQSLSQFISQYQRLEQQLNQQNLSDVATATRQRHELQKQLQQSVEQFGAIQEIEQKLLTLRQDRSQHAEKLNQLQLMKQQVQHLTELHQTENELNQKLKQSKTQHLSIEQNAVHTEQHYIAMKTEHQQLVQVLQQQRLLHAENIEHLRAELKADEPCLVCGSTEHPYREENTALSKALYELQQQQQQQAELKEQEAFQAWQQATQQLTQLSADLKQFETQLQSSEAQSAKIKQTLLDQAQRIQWSINIENTPVELSQQLQVEIETLMQLQNEIATADLNLEQARKEQSKLTQNIEQLKNVIDRAEQLQQQIQHIVDCCDDAERLAWQKQVIPTAQLSLAHLSQRAEQLKLSEELSKDIDKHIQQQQLLQSSIQHLNTQIEESDLVLKEVSEKGKQNNLHANQLILTMTGLDNVKAHEWLGQHDQQRQQAQTQYQQQKQKFEQLRQEHDAKKQELQHLIAQQQQNLDSLAQTEAQITAWLIQHTDFGVELLEQLSQISATAQQQIRQNIQNSERLLNETQTTLNTLQDQLKQHLTEQPNHSFDDLKVLVEQHSIQFKAQQDRRDQLKLKLDHHHQNIAKQQQYAAQIQAIQQEEHRWGKISGLMGDSTGKKFRDYAQQYNLDILIEHANQQLTMLSQRYTLKRLDNSLSLAIIDHDMDGEMRSVSSLSGGESFLTALALSLAIANMASGSMKIESLFIDEGFGTLDASSLHMVMNALDQLQSQGRKVVLISHIQEMHERIPVQIQVNPMGAGASTVQVVS